MARKRSKKGTEKHLNLQCKQCTREQEPKVDGMAARVPAGVYRNTSTAARVQKERVVLEKTLVKGLSSPSNSTHQWRGCCWSRGCGRPVGSSTDVVRCRRVKDDEYV